MTILSRKILAISAVLSLLPSSAVLAEEENEDSSVIATAHKQYQDECGACHFAYPAGLLPARSWEKLLSNLGDHFGENAELDAKTVATLSDYLTKNAADKVRNRLSRRLASSVAHTTPLRITETPFFKREHREVPQRLVKDNPQVQSFSKCQVCHTRAASGSFRESEINIPGHGRWD